MMAMDNICDPARMLLSRFNDSHQKYVKHIHYTFGLIYNQGKIPMTSQIICKSLETSRCQQVSLEVLISKSLREGTNP